MSRQYHITTLGVSFCLFLELNFTTKSLESCFHKILDRTMSPNDTWGRDLEVSKISL